MLELFVYCKETEIYRMLSHSRVKFLRSLQIKKYRDKENSFLIEGDKLVKEILLPDNNNGFTPVEIFGLPEWEKANSELIKSSDVNFTYVNKQQLDQISLQKNPNQVLALVHYNASTHSKTPAYNGLALAFDRLQDPGNLGTIIRLADWFGISHIVLSENSVDHFNPKVIQATMGSFFRVPVYKLDLTKWLASKPDKLPVFGAILNAPSIYDTEISSDGVILLGNESTGIRQELNSFINESFSIPSYSVYHKGAESLNVGMATGIILSEFKRRTSL